MKKYFMMLSALLILGAASVTMTSCKGDDEEKPGTEQGGDQSSSAKVPTTVAEANQMLKGQWRVPQTVVDKMLELDIWTPCQADEFYMEFGENSYAFIFRVREDASEYWGKYAGAYCGTLLGEPDVEFPMWPNEANPTRGQFPLFFASGAAFLTYRNLTSESVEVYCYYEDEDGNDIFGGLGWQRFTKVKTPVKVSDYFEIG